MSHIGVIDLPRANNRSLCSYLAEESVEHGMLAYMDVAFNRWYQPLVDNWKLVREKVPMNHTMFVCYEQLSHPKYQLETMGLILGWLFPSGHNVDVREIALGTTYNGAHSTSHDETLRSTLKDVIKTLDVRYFGGQVEFLNDQFGCGKSQNDGK